MKKFIYLAFATLFIAVGANAQHQNTKVKVGEPAPELAFENPNGDTIRLSELNNKRIILIDFWASWCGPCRRANPRLVKMYNDYKDKKFVDAKNGFTILSVSLDQNKEKWKAAIEKDGLSWEYHISDLGGWYSKAAEAYGVQYIPQAVLVGPDGKIIAHYNSAEQAAVELKKRVKDKKKFLGLF